MTTVEADRWIVMRNRVSLVGRVTAAGGAIANGGVISLAAAQAANGQGTTSPSRTIGRRYDTRVRPDGFYFFLDLPAGEYLLDGEDEHGNEIEAREVSIPHAVGSGPLQVVTVDLSASTKPGADAPPPDQPPMDRGSREPQAPVGPATRRELAANSPQGSGRKRQRRSSGRRD
jgi:hypothetical protein